MAAGGCALFQRPPPPPPPAPAKEIPCPSPQAQSLEGWVLLSVRVRADGSVESAKVLRSHPRGRFEDEAVDKVSRSHFHPKIVDGKPVAQEGLQCVEFERESI
jgi:protein TonB